MTTARSAISTSGRRSPPTGRSPTSSRPASPASRTASATRSRSNTRRPARGDYRIPALTVEHADGSTVLDLVYAEHRIVAGKPALAGRRPARDLRRGRRRGRHARGRPRRRPERPRASTSPTRSSATARSSPAAPASATTAPTPVRLTGAMSAALDLPDARWEFVQLSGAWARENHVVDTPPAPGPPVGRQRPRRLEPPAQPVHRPAPRDDDRGGRRGLRLQPRLLGQLPRRGRGRRVRHDPGPARDQPEHVHLDARAGRVLRDPGGRPRLLGRRARRDERRAPRPLPRAPGARHVARRAAAGPPQQLGGDLLRLRRGEAARDRDVRARPRRRAVRPRRRLVRRARLGRLVARRLVRRPAQAARTASTASPRRSRRSASGSACGSSPR